MDDSEERMRILEMIESGKISAEQGLSLLQALNAAEDDTDEDDALPLPSGPPTPMEETASSFALPEASRATVETGEVIDPAPVDGESLHQRAERLRGWWIVPMWAGVGITLLGGVLMYAAIQRSAGAISLLFLCATLPFAIGLLVMMLAWASRTSPWLHLRVQQAPGASPQRIALSFPLPLGLGGWFVRSFGGYIPSLRDQPIEEILKVVEQTTVSGDPIHIEVDEGEQGEKVEIFIG